MSSFSLATRCRVPPTPAASAVSSWAAGYIHSEISVGSSAEIAAALPSDAAWKVWEDPKYEHLGEVHLNHPDLGVFVADCDAQVAPCSPATRSTASSSAPTPTAYSWGT